MNIKHQSTQHFVTIGLGTLLMGLLIVSCSKKNSEGNEFGLNPLTDKFGSDFNTTYDPGLNPGGTAFDLGTGKSGGLGSADKIGLENMFSEMDTVNPQEEVMDSKGGGDIPILILQQAQTLLNTPVTTANAAQIAAQKIALGGQMLAACMTSIEKYGPQPGEPYQGTWSQGCANADIVIAGNYSRNFTRRTTSSFVDTQNPGFNDPLRIGLIGFSVSGGIQGSMTANSGGVGSILAGDFRAVLSDLPAEVPVTVNGTSHILTKGTGITSKSGCVKKIVQKSWTNQMRPKHVEGMRRLAQCYRKALFLMSPIMDKLFDNMDPRLASLLKVRMLGIPQ